MDHTRHWQQFKMLQFLIKVWQSFVQPQPVFSCSSDRQVQSVSIIEHTFHPLTVPHQTPPFTGLSTSHTCGLPAPAAVLCC